MKITIELNENEVKAIKAYLGQFAEDGEKIGKAEIKQEIEGMVNSSLQCGSIGDYYRLYCMQPSNDLDRTVIAGSNNNDDY